MFQKEKEKLLYFYITSHTYTNVLYIQSLKRIKKHLINYLLFILLEVFNNDLVFQLSRQ